MKLLYGILYVLIIALVIFGAVYIQEQLNAEINTIKGGNVYKSESERLAA